MSQAIVWVQFSLLTLTAISVDRLLALLLGLRYRQVVTLKRTCLTVAVIWAISVVQHYDEFLQLPHNRMLCYVRYLGEMTFLWQNFKSES